MTGNNNIDWARPLGLVITRDAMNGGMLDAVDERIVSVRFLESVQAQTTTGTPTTTGGERGTVSADNDIPGYVWAIIASGIVVLIVSVVYLAKRIRNQGRREPRDDYQEPLKHGEFDPEAENVHRSWSNEEQQETSWNSAAQNDPLIVSSAEDRRAARRSFA